MKQVWAPDGALGKGRGTTRTRNMKRSYVRKGLWVGLWAGTLGGSLSAQGIDPGHGVGGNLENDIRGPVPETSWELIGQLPRPRRAGGELDLSDDIRTARRPRFDPRQIHDAGTFYVDLEVNPGLELDVELLAQLDKPFRAEREKVGRLRLSGGQPGNAGAIVLSASGAGNDGLLRGPAIAGVFGEDGSFVVELPALSSGMMDHTFYAQGVELSGAGAQAATSARSRILPVGGVDGWVETRLGEEMSWTVEEISDAVRRATKDLLDEEVARMRLYGPASLATLDGFVDVTVELSKEKGGFLLHVGPLAQVSRLVPAEDRDGASFHFRTAEELAGAVEAVAVLATFGDIETELSWAQARLEAERARMKGSVGAKAAGQHAGQPSTADRNRRASAPTAMVRRELGDDEAIVLGGATPIDGKPHRAGKREPEPARPSRDSHFTGPIRDAGTVDLGEDEEVVSGWSATEIKNKPRRAGKAELGKTPHDSYFTGPVHDAGTVKVDLSAQDFDKARREAGSLGSASRHLDLLRKQVLRHSL